MGVLLYIGDGVPIMKLLSFGIVILSSISLLSKINTSLDTITNPLLSDRMKSTCFQDTKEVIKEACNTVITLHTNLISWDTFRLAVTVFPFFIISRMHDKKLHNCFYDQKYHKNGDQLPRFFFDMAEYGIGVPIVLLGSYALYGKTAETRKIGRTFLTAMPFVIFGKDIIKMLDYDFCKRPWNEKFNRHKQACGGFPSGHMAQAVYMASFFGMEYGPSHAIPLGIFAGLVGITFINCNRHYLSQIVAGAAWGGMFAISSHKIMKQYHAEKRNIEVGLGMNDYGGAAMALRYAF